MAAVNANKKKFKKQYYSKSWQNKSSQLSIGLKGFLISCNNFETQCVREAYNILNEFADELFGPETKDPIHPEKSSDVDIEQQLAKEIQDLKASHVTRRFQQVDTHVKNVLFIKTTVPNPTELVESIFENIVRTNTRKTRYILKLTPVEFTCKFFRDDLVNAANEFFENLAANSNDSETRYKIICKIRNNNTASSDHVFWYLRESIEKCLPNWTPDLFDPQTIVSVDILRTICCVGILRNFKAYRKYNLAEVVPPVVEKRGEVVPQEVEVGGQVDQPEVEVGGRVDPPEVEVGGEVVTPEVEVGGEVVTPEVEVGGKVDPPEEECSIKRAKSDDVAVENVTTEENVQATEK